MAGQGAAGGGAEADARRDELLALILAVSFRRERVTLASGRESDFYLDLRQTLMRPRGVLCRKPAWMR